MSTLGPGLRPVSLAWLERAGDRRYVESETRIGRGDRNNFQLNDPSISRDHALIRRVEGDYVLSDLDSSNGTFVNDERVYEPRHLSPGDRVRLANVEFSFDIDAPVLGTTQDLFDRPLATSISQFLTISAQINTQDYLEGDLRVVTVLFLDLCGFTALSERMSPEQITVVVNQCFQHLTETATRFGGFVDKYIGDAMMVLFGAPQAHDDDAERSVRAAIAMQERLTRFSRRLKQRSGIALQMRVGINTGEVLAGAVGSGQFTAFTVMGDAVNLASRLEEHARVGRILVSEATYALTRHVVQYDAGTTTSIRGKHEHVNAFEVEGLASEAASDEASRFVGRVRESAELERLLAQTGQRRTALLRGPAGSGKSRLVEHVRRIHAGNAEFVAIRCSDFVERGPSVAAQSVVRTLQRSVAARPTLVDNADVPTQSGEPDLDDGPPSGAWLEVLANSVATLLRSLTRDRPLLVCLERLELADSTTLSLLQSIFTRLDDCDILLLATTRTLSAAAWPTDAHVVELPPLDPDDSGVLLRAATGGVTIDQAAAEHLVELSAGTPGPLLELTRVALDSGQLQLVDGQLQLPAQLDIRRAFAVRGRIQAELDGLTPQDRTILCVLTLGSRLPTVVLERTLELSHDAAVEALERLVGRGYVQRSPEAPGGVQVGYQVRDELTRLVIDASLTQVERRRLHERVALALQHAYDPGQPDPRGLLRIAQHFAAAGQAWHSVEYLLRAADLKATTASVETAVEFYRSVLDEAVSLSDARERARLTLEIQDRIGEALLWGGNLAEAQIAFEQAAGNSASAQRRAELQLKLGLIGLRRGNPRRVFQIGRAALTQPEAPTAMLVGGNALISLARAAQGMLRDAIEYADSALKLAVDAGDPGLLGLAQFATGRAQFLAGDLVAARQSLQRSVAARDAAGDVTAAAESRIQLGVIQRSLGELDDAELSVRNALEQPEPTLAGGSPVVGGRPAAAHWRHRWTLASAALVLGRLRLDRDDPTRARRYFASAFRAAEALAAREMALEARVELGSLEASSATATLTGEALVRVLDELRSVLDAALALELRPLACRTRIALGTVLCSDTGIAMTRSSARAEGHAQAREAALLARDALLQARSLGLKLQGAGARQLLATALAQLGYWAQAVREFETTTVELEQLGASVELVRALVTYAAVERSAGSPVRPDEVRLRLARAAELAERIGLARDHQLALGLLSGAGA